mgnify:CR=1 FL=1
MFFPNWQENDDERRLDPKFSTGNFQIRKAVSAIVTLSADTARRISLNTGGRFPPAN